MNIHTNSAAETEAIGEAIGKQLRGGEVIELASDLGGGKTTFTRGLARGIGSKDVVASPTFTISKLYKGPDISLVHFDFYRLQEPGLIAYELQDSLSDPNVVVVVEWGDIVEGVLPESRVIIRLKHIAEDKRELHIQIPAKLNYLAKDLLTT